jgi:hypothetical protein
LNTAHGWRRITKPGNSRARTLLVEAAWLILRSKHVATAALRGWAERQHGLLNRPVLLVANSGPSCISRWFREDLAKVKIAATGVSAFSQVRIEDPMPTQLGLPEQFDETLKAEEVYWDLYADPRVGSPEKDQKTEARPKTESA